ncbi:hypothetical protein EV361DRAFT_433517 [Lentinula raphanica]|nr:hypothetical protein EV361DRAFT_433517 [Lentinula raphanica]
MAIQAHTALREDALSRLSRAELQALGKAHEIKANLKSITIISQLLKKFPGGVPNPNPNQSAPARKKGRAKKGGVKKKKTQVKKEESVAPSVLSAKSEDEDSPIEQQNTASTSHDPPPTSEQQQQRTPPPPPPARSLRRRTTRTSARAGLQAPTGTVIREYHHDALSSKAYHIWPSALTESAQGSPVPTEIVASPVPTEIVASPVPTEPVTEPSRRADQAAASQNAPEVDVPRASRSESNHNDPHVDDPDEMDMDNFSDASSVTHNISESSRGSSPQPVTNDATLKYVVDIIKANTEKDEQLRDEIEQLQERAIKAKKLLQEQYYLLNAEREHRDRIMTFLIYHIRNNNRWIGQFANADKLPPAVFEQMVSNGGRGWRDMGEWEYGEVWSGPMVVSESNIEITGSNLEEYLRDMWDIHQRQRMEEKATEDESSADK